MLSYTISMYFKMYLPYQNDFKWLTKWAYNKKPLNLATYFVTTLRNCIFQKDALSKYIIVIISTLTFNFLEFQMQFLLFLK